MYDPPADGCRASPAALVADESDEGALSRTRSVREKVLARIRAVITDLATRVATLELEAAELEDALAARQSDGDASADVLQRLWSRDSASDGSLHGAEFLTGAPLLLQAWRVDTSISRPPPVLPATQLCLLANLL